MRSAILLAYACWCNDWTRSLYRGASRIRFRLSMEQRAHPDVVSRRFVGQKRFGFQESLQ